MFDDIIYSHKQQCSKIVHSHDSNTLIPMLLKSPTIRRLLDLRLRCRLYTCLLLRGNLTKPIIARSANFMLEHAVKVDSQSTLLASTFAS